MKDNQVLRPGDCAPAAGFYRIIDVDGTLTDVVYRIKKKGVILPPTYRKRQSFVRFKPGEHPKKTG